MNLKKNLEKIKGLKFSNLFSNEGLSWQKLRSRTGGVGDVYRTAVPGGWLISHGVLGGLTFVPDEHHEWDGDSLPVYEYDDEE